MEITLELIVFTVLAVFTAVSAVLAVTTKRILRAATYLLFVLFGTAGIYFQLNYSFLGAVQLLIYAGGITVLYVFSILLTSSQGDKSEDIKGYKLFVGLAATLLSLGVCLYVTLRHDFMPSHFVHGELDVQTIGHALMSSGKYGYILPFEPQPARDADLRRADPQFGRHQFRRIQPLPVPRTAGGILLHAIRHRHQRRRNGRRNRHHHQHLPEPAQHRGEEPAGDEVVTILKKRLLWNIRSLSCCCRC